MLIKDYLDSKTQGRRILIVSDIARGQALIRRYEKMTGAMARNVNCMTIKMMADAVYKFIIAENSYDDKEYIILDDTEAAVLFKSVLLSNINRLTFFNEEKMMDSATVREIFNKVMLVRANGWNGDEDKEKNDRISDIKVLVSEYENKLKAKGLMDIVSKERFVFEKISEFTNTEYELKGIFSAEISYLAEDTETLNGIESELLNCFINAEKPDVYAFEDSVLTDTFSGCDNKAEFYKGYGSFNEANYIANDIFEKKYPFGNVMVLYSSDEQLPTISAALRGNGIPMKAVSPYRAKENAYISLVKRIIDWSLSDYSEKVLDEILSSNVIYIEDVDENGKKINLLSGQKYFDHVLDARNRREDGFSLGWGYERNIEFLKHELKIAKDAKDDRTEKILKMHRILLDIFGDKGKPYDDKNLIKADKLLEKMTAFIDTYTVKGNIYAVAADALKKISSALHFDDRDRSLSEALNLIEEFLSEVTMSDEEDDFSVTVKQMQDWTVLERPNVYITGLALKDIQGSTTESPVLFDDEMERFLENGYVPTIKKQTERREKNMRYTVRSFEGESIVFGYSDYDTVNFVENNASAFFREALRKIGKQELRDLPEFVYGNPMSGAGNTSVPSRNIRPSFDVKLATSSSTLEVLLDCPKKYAFSKIMYIPENDFAECDYGQWLDARLLGSFFHEIAEKYCNTKLVAPSSEEYEKKVDEGLVKTIAETVKQKMLKEAPCAFKELADKETDTMVSNAVRYLQRLLDELNGPDKWRVLVSEQDFSDASYPVKGFDGKKYDFVFNGFIDRIDYRIDRDAEKCFLRIADYKTGKKDSKVKVGYLGKLVQYAIYEKALMETGKVKKPDGTEVNLLDHIRSEIAKLEADDSVKGFTFEFESFQYVFPMERKDEEPYVLTKTDLEGTNFVRLKSILAVLEHKQVYPDRKEFKELLDELINDYPKEETAIKGLKETIEAKTKDEIKSCDYCKYNYMCANRKAGEI